MGTQTRRLLVNLALLLIVAGVGGRVWWQTSQPEKSPPTLLALGKGEITRIGIVRHPGTPQADSIRMEKQPGEQWQMLEPKQAKVNHTRITQLFTLLDETVTASYDATGKDLKQYALQPGNVALTLNGQTLLFGMENPVSHQRYILHDGRIKLVSEAVYGLLTGTPGEWLGDPSSAPHP